MMRGMTIEERNKSVTVRVTKDVTRKLKLVAAVRANGESAGILIAALVDKEMRRLGLEGNNSDDWYLHK